VGAKRANDTYGSRSRRNRASRTGGQVLTRARSATYTNGLPSRVPFRMSRAPDGRTRTHHPGRSRRDPRRSVVRQHLAAFIPHTNAIEALNRQLRKELNTKGHFPSEDAARKLLYLGIHNAVLRWTRTRGWTKALLSLKIHFGNRLPD
jgi:hypothetical protein